MPTPSLVSVPAPVPMMLSISVLPVPPTVLNGPTMPINPAPFVTELADNMLKYITRPLAEADARLLQALRSYDGTQDAGNLIGLAADALERR